MHPFIDICASRAAIIASFFAAAFTLPCAAHTLGAQRASAAADADLVLLHGKIITVDSTDRIAQAIAVRGSKIIAVGSDAEIARFVSAGTRRIDLKGRAVTPGLIDAHAHFADAASSRMYVTDLSYPIVKNIPDVLAKMSEQVKKAGKGKWVQGTGWDEGKLIEKRQITAKDLDAVSLNNPVWLQQTTGHYGVANSAALALAGITRVSKDPPNGTVDRYPDGTPTGVLKEAAQSIVHRLIPPRTTVESEAAMRELAKAFNAEGMTALKDPGIDDETWASYQKVSHEGKLPVRVFALWLGGRSVEGAKRVIAKRAATSRPYESTGDDHVISGGIKMYIDGSGGARTAWLYSDWNREYTKSDSGNRGYPASNPDTVRLLIRMYHDAGFHVSTHSIGDRAIDWTMDSYAAAMKANPKKGLRHGIIHSNIPTDHALDLMSSMQRDFDAGYPEPSATFHWWLGDTYSSNFGTSRSLRLNPFATYVKRGIRWANGSDLPVTPFAARYGIWAAVARETLLGTNGDAFGRAESVDVHTSLRAVTIWAAHQLFLEKKIGSIEVGKYADLAVWDRDPYTVPTAALKDMQCQLTLFDGRVVYRAPNAGM
ncbi:MAG: amidohydrolase [Gemmatimonadaceae bacterium]